MHYYRTYQGVHYFLHFSRCAFLLYLSRYALFLHFSRCAFLLYLSRTQCHFSSYHTVSSYIVPCLYSYYFRTYPHFIVVIKCLVNQRNCAILGPNFFCFSTRFLIMLWICRVFLTVIAFALLCFIYFNAVLLCWVWWLQFCSVH